MTKQIDQVRNHPIVKKSTNNVGHSNGYIQTMNDLLFDTQEKHVSSIIGESKIIQVNTRMFSLY